MTTKIHSKRWNSKEVDRQGGSASAAVAAVLLTTVLGACSSFQGDALDAMEAFSGGEKHESFVEVYLEFSSGDPRWAAPQSVLLHVDASDPEMARIEMGPFDVRHGGASPRISISSDARAPASASVEGMVETPAETTAETTASTAAESKDAVKFTSEEAREQMGRLFLAFEQDSAKTAKGCLFPIRARLVKADGAIVDREGCRGQRGWNRTASEIAERWLSLTLRRRLAGSS